MIKFAPAKPAVRTGDVVQALQAAGYWKRRTFLAKNVRPSYPRFLYKYKVSPKAASDPVVRHLRDMLVSSNLWLSSPRDFNDPFDTNARVIFQADAKTLRQRFERLVEAEGRKTGMLWKERQRTVAKFMARDPSEWLRAAHRVFEKNSRETGVFSFAGDPRSVLMWSHYGDHHTGLCLQFEVARDPQTMLEALPIRYVSEYPTYNWAANDSTDSIIPVLTHKYESWAYEEERRIVWPSGAHTFLPFDPAAIVGLIFGCKTSDIAKQVVLSILAERTSRGLPDVRVYEAKMHGQKYAIQIRRRVTP